MGLLDNLRSPMTQIGLGIMDYNAPRMSKNPADLKPSGFGPGLLAGLNNLNEYEQQQAENEYKSGLLGVQQDTLRDKRQTDIDKARQAQAEMAAGQRWIQGLAPQEQAQALAYLQAGGDIKDLMGRYDKASSLPPDAELAKWLMPDGTHEEQVAAVAAYKRANARAGASANTLIGGPQGFEPQTAEGKLAFDYQQALKMPDSDVKTRLLKALEQKLTSSGTGAEAQARMTKYKIAEATTSAFNQLADANEGDVGLFGGTLTKLKGEGGFVGNMLRLVNDTTTAEALLNSMSTQMKTQLGTALSGAAIPVTEWPNYEAQIPLVTDSKQARHAKARTLAQMIKVAEAIERGEATKADLDALLGGVQQGSAPKTDMKDLSGVSDDELKRELGLL